MFAIVLVTLTEGLAVYWWLRLAVGDDFWLAFGVLFAGETLETLWVAGPTQRAGPEASNLEP